MSDPSDTNQTRTENDAAAAAAKEAQTQQPNKTRWQAPPPPPPEGMSKSAWKRELKRQNFEARRQEFADKRREKKKQIRQRRREQAERGENDQPLKPQKPRAPEDQVKLPMNVVIDCGFDDMMKDGERTSLANQIMRCYADNKLAHKKVQLEVTSFNGHLKNRFDNVLKRQHEKWKDITFNENDYDTSNTANTIYLSSDSSDTIHELEHNTTYIIGGIVDKGRYKNLCYDKARGQSIRTARLPIDEFVKMSGRRVLTTNHVFEIMLEYLHKRDWKSAFETVLPSRKLTAHQEDGNEGDENAEDEEDEGDEGDEDNVNKVVDAE